MCQNKETITIDLTEVDIELPEKRQGVPFVNDNNLVSHIINTEKQPLGDEPPCLPKRALLADPKDTDLQHEVAAGFMEDLKNNPHIETVFIESDEDDNMKQIKLPRIAIQNMVVINAPAKKCMDVDKGSLQNVTCTPTAATNDKITSSQPSLPAMTNNALPFSVNSITPLTFMENFADNSITLALPNETDKLSPKKYLVIPKELVSFLANKKSPISLNVPGIGPLLIQNPSVMFSSQGPIPYVNNPSQELKQKKMPKEVVYDPLTDRKYCWRYLRNRKRDMEGLTMSDRLGFYREEQRRTKTCASKFNEIIKRLQLTFNMKEQRLMANSKLNMKHIKLVEIDRIKKGRKRGLHSGLQQGKHQDNVKIKMSPLSAKSKQNSLFSPMVSQIQLSSESDSSNHLDLLVTKKVVFINGPEHPRGKKKRRGWFNSRYRTKMQKLKDQGDEESLPNQMVHEADLNARKTKVNIKDKPDLLQKKNQKGMSRKKDKVMPLNKNQREKMVGVSNKSNLKKQNFVKHEFRDYKTQAVKGPTNKLNSTVESKKKLSHDKLNEIKQCHIDIPHSKLVQDALEKYNAYTLTYIKDLGNKCNIIKDLKQFQQEIQPIKPILVINERHCPKMDFQDLFCKYNLVFPMSENVENTHFVNLNITNRLFVESAKKGYIKFVLPRILCKYLAGFREP